MRLREANALMKSNLMDGAYYLAGYAVECALKACIARSTKRFEFPDKKKVDSSYTHNLRELVKLAGLHDNLIERTGTDKDFLRNWEVVQLWSEDSRYRKHTAESARVLIAAICDKSHGVFSWIQQQW